jgi:hypothetical protein
MVGFRPTIHAFLGHHSIGAVKKPWMVATSATMTTSCGAIDGASLPVPRVGDAPAYLMMTWWANS